MHSLLQTTESNRLRSVAIYGVICMSAEENERLTEMDMDERVHLSEVFGATEHSRPT